MDRQDIERLSNLEIEMKNINEKLDAHVKEQREDFDKVFKKLDCLEDKFEKKFAAKWVEKVSLGLIVSLLGAIIAFILGKF